MHWSWNTNLLGLGWLWIWLAAVVTIGWLGMRGNDAAVQMARLQLTIATCGLLFMLSQSEAMYRVLPQLGRIQFPWRWFALTTPAALCILAALALAGRWQRWAACVLASCALALSLPALRSIEFATGEHAQLDRLLRCERAKNDCSQYIATGERADHFEGLAFAGQHARHYGPWIRPDGRVWRYEVYDYMPREIAVETWPRASGSRMAMPPFITTTEGWSSTPPGAVRVLGMIREPARWVLELKVHEPGMLTLEQLRFAGWELRLRAAGQDYVTVQAEPDETFYQVNLQPGRYRLQLRQVGTRAEHLGEAVSLVTLAFLLMLAWRYRASRSVKTKQARQRHPDSM